MSLPAVSAMPPRRSSLAASPSGRGCRLLVGGYALLGAAGCGYLFYISTLPVRIPDDWLAQGPAWLGAWVFLATLVAGLPWAILPVPLLFGGLTHLRRAAPGRRHSRVAWGSAVAAGAGLEALVITQFGYHIPWPTYTGPGTVSWIALAESAGFVVLGVTLAAILAGGERSPEWQLSRVRAGP